MLATSIYTENFSGAEPTVQWTHPEPITQAVDATTFSEEQEAEIDRRINAALKKQGNLKKGLRFGYENGFVLVSPTGVKAGASKAPFSMRINSWFQFRHTNFDSDGPNLDENDLEFERLRLTFQGNVYSPDLRYFIQFDGDSDQGEVSDWLDYYFIGDFGHAGGLDKGRLGMKVGKWKLPFNRSRANAGWKLAFTDRTIASVFFDINRSQAIALFGACQVFDRKINWETAVSNGFKTSGYRPVRRGELDRNFGYSARMWGDLCGEWGTDGESDLSDHRSPAVRVGAGFAHTTVDTEGTREYSAYRVVDSGSRVVDLLPGTTAYDVTYFAVDANVKYRGATLISEFYYRALGDFEGAAVASLRDHGFMVQLGKFIVCDRLEFLMRWSRIVGDSGTLGARDESADEIGAGLAWYLRGHRAKVVFDATHLNGAPILDRTLNILPGDDGMLYRTQLQIYF